MGASTASMYAQALEKHTQPALHTAASAAAEGGEEDADGGLENDDEDTRLLVAE